MPRRAAGTLIFALTTVVASAAPGPAVASPWVRVQSAHFTVSGNVGERQALDVAARLEQFRGVLLRVFPGTHLAVRPLFVVAFDSEEAFTPYKPLYNGKPAPVSGYFSWTSDGSCVTLQLDRGEDSYPIIFHEYTHLFLTQVSRRLPSWVGEGVSEYYSTVEIVDRGRRANIGKPIARHLQRLQEGLMSLRDQLVVTPASKIWSDRHDAALFYAQSWALVHFLTSRPGGAEKINTLVQRLQSGGQPVETFEEVFGPIDALERALRRYVQSASYPYVQYEFTAPISVERAPARPMSVAEVEASLATVLIDLRREEDAASHVAAAVREAPDLPEVRRARGLLERRLGRMTEAERDFRTAVERAPGDIDAAYYWGLTVIETQDSDSAVLQRALEAVAAALPRDDPPADMLMVQGVLQGLTGRLDAAEASLRRSMALAPGQTRTTVALSEILAGRGKFVEARAIVEPMLATPSYPGEADLARSQLEWLRRAEAQAKQREEIARLTGQPAGGGRPPSAGGAPGTRGSGGPGRFSPVYRQVGEGEQRELGVLERIDCGPSGLVLQVKAGEGTLRFHAARFDQVEFITYREDLRGAVNCGPRDTGEAVYVTWKPVGEILPAPLGTIAGRVVAVEFLPR